MKWFRNKKDKPSTRLFSQLVNWIHSLPLLKRFKIRQRLRLLNIKATQRPRKYMSFFMGFFVLLLAVNIFLWLIPAKDQPSSMTQEMAEINQTMQGFRMIQSVKEMHQSKLVGMVDNGDILRHELDSLVSLPEKTHEDSLAIMRKHKQLKIIVTSLNPDK